MKAGRLPVAAATLGLPIPWIMQYGPSASAVILADRDATEFGFEASRGL